LNSSLATVHRYRTATKHLENFVADQPKQPRLHEIRPDAFAVYLRKLEVAPNGHKNSGKRKLRHKGIQFILETCRSMYNFALKRRHLPPYVGNPFLELPLDRLKIEDAKPIFVSNRPPSWPSSRLPRHGLSVAVLRPRSAASNSAWFSFESSSWTRSQPLWATVRSWAGFVKSDSE